MRNFFVKDLNFNLLEVLIKKFDVYLINKSNTNTTTKQSEVKCLKGEYYQTRNHLLDTGIYFTALDLQDQESCSLRGGGGVVPWFLAH